MLDNSSFGFNYKLKPIFMNTLASHVRRVKELDVKDKVR